MTVIEKEDEEEVDKHYTLHSEVYQGASYAEVKKTRYDSTTHDPQLTNTTPTTQKHHDHSHNRRRRAAAKQYKKRQKRKRCAEHAKYSTFVVIQKNVRSLKTSDRIEESLREVEGCKWDSLLLCGTWRPAKADI